MYKQIPEEVANELWDHQKDALYKVITHINKKAVPFLIRMPTGTGKTGVIACLSCISNQGRTLIVTPWKNLREQMMTDIEINFWAKINKPSYGITPIEIFPSSIEDVLDKSENNIFITTFSSLTTIYEKDKHNYSKLSNKISLAIIDECHYEPAVKWGRAVKNLSTNTVLLTATPYRNDLKLFRINNPEKETFHYKHKDAVSKKIIRKLEFDEFSSPNNIRELSEEFCLKWRHYKENRKLPSSSPKAIITCAESEEIEIVVSVLQEKKIKVLGIHENFQSREESYLTNIVPKTQTNDDEVWVHQYKLTEGLDDDRFCCLALFTNITNNRRLIQQIGRILRVNDNDKDCPAIVISNSGNLAKEFWEAYLDFEQNLELLNPNHFINVINDILDLQPSAEYLDKRFRKKFSPDQLSQNPQVIIPPSVIVKKISSSFDLKEYIDYNTDNLNLSDAVILGTTNAPCIQEDNHALWVYASIKNSDALINQSLYELSLETHCIIQKNDFLFICDSKGIYPTEYLEKNTTNISMKNLLNFINNEFKPTNISTISSIPYDTVIRGTDLRGHNLLNIPTSLTDSVQICQTISAKSAKLGNRYIGINRGRIRKDIGKYERKSYDFVTFLHWVDEISDILETDGEQNLIFSRYMQPCTPPDNPIPKLLSIDLYRDDIQLQQIDGTECEIKHSSIEVFPSEYENNDNYRCIFDIVNKNGEELNITLTIQYDKAKNIFLFEKQHGAQIHAIFEGAESIKEKTLSKFLNLHQDILIISLDDGETVYQGKMFYKIDYSYAENALVDLFVRKENDSFYSEKGSANDIKELKQDDGKLPSDFPSYSLFYAVKNNFIDLPFDKEFLICDDIGTECADFIAGSFRDKSLALIHVKVDSKTTISASGFHDIVAQAIKNLVFLSRTSEAPKNINSWNRRDTWNKTHIPKLLEFKDVFPEEHAFWQKIQSEIINTSDPNLYVILVTSGCSNSNYLHEVLRNPDNRTAETAQLFHLLTGLQGYARQLGVRVQIIDFPYNPK